MLYFSNSWKKGGILGMIVVTIIVSVSILFINFGFELFSKTQRYGSHAYVPVHLTEGGIKKIGIDILEQINESPEISYGALIQGVKNKHNEDYDDYINISWKYLLNSEDSKQNGFMVAVNREVMDALNSCFLQKSKEDEFIDDCHRVLHGLIKNNVKFKDLDDEIVKKAKVWFINAALSYSGIPEYENCKGVLEKMHNYIDNYMHNGTDTNNNNEKLVQIIKSYSSIMTAPDTNMYIEESRVMVIIKGFIIALFISVLESLGIANNGLLNYLKSLGNN